MLRKTLARRILLTALFVAALAVAIAASFGHKNSASAKPCFSIDTVYYSDATYTTEVGERYTPCDGSPWSWGDDLRILPDHHGILRRPARPVPHVLKQHGTEPAACAAPGC